MTVERVSRDDFAKSFDKLVQGLGGNGLNSVILFDIDGLIYWNDWFGHEIGDHLIEEVMFRIERASPHGVLSRIGGDEFALGIAESGWGLALSLKNIARGILDHVALIPIPIADWIPNLGSVTWPPSNWPSGREYVELEELRVTVKALVIEGDAASVSILLNIGHDPRSWFELIPTGWMGPNSIVLVPSDNEYIKRLNNRINGRDPWELSPPAAEPST
jgi:GGDEF domain-containing protein